MQGHVRSEPGPLRQVSPNRGVRRAGRPTTQRSSIGANVLLDVDVLRVVWANMKWSRALLFLFGLTVFWTGSLFVAPFTVAPGTFAFTEGGANVVDHWNLYQGAAFNWYAKVIYTVGDAQCHQLWYRSLWLNGNQLPIDARMTSLYLFGIFGLYWAMMTPPAPTASGGILNAFPQRVQRWAY